MIYRGLAKMTVADLNKHDRVGHKVTHDISQKKTSTYEEKTCIYDKETYQ